MTFESWLTFELFMGAQTQTNRHINTMNRPGLGARPSKIIKKCEKTLQNNNINNYKTRIVTKLNHLNYDQPKKTSHCDIHLCLKNFKAGHYTN